METKQETTRPSVARTRPSEVELEETHVERELNLLMEMTLRMEHELRTLIQEE